MANNPMELTSLRFKELRRGMAACGLPDIEGAVQTRHSRRPQFTSTLGGKKDNGTKVDL